MQLAGPGSALELVDLPVPVAGPGEVLIEVGACGVCRTDLHVVDGDLTDGRYPLVPGHQIVGRVVDPSDTALALGTRVGVPWLGYTCDQCGFCGEGRENLCDRAEFTGYHRQGGYAEFVAADARYCFVLPESDAPGHSDVQTAPLLCAGLIGYRALRMTGEARHIGFYGFGNAAHILTQIAAWQGRSIYAFTRDGDAAGQAFARQLGAVWAGPAGVAPPRALDAAIVFAPVGSLVPEALRRIRKGAAVICAGIHMSQIPAFSYDLLWGERSLRSVANLTRADGRELLDLAARAGVHTEVSVYPLAQTVAALNDLRAGRVRGAAVVTPR